MSKFSSAICQGSPRSPTTAGHSPKSSPSPDTSRSPSAGPGFSGARCPVVAAGRRSRGLGSPRAASPFNPHTEAGLLTGCQGIKELWVSIIWVCLVYRVHIYCIQIVYPYCHEPGATNGVSEPHSLQQPCVWGTNPTHPSERR